MYEGSCLCGEVRYRIAGELSDFGYCHCTSCRKASGSAFGANVGVQRSEVSVKDPGGYQQDYESSPGKKRVFCRNCGSPLYAYLDSSPDILRIRLGSLDSKLEKTAKAHSFVADKATWEQIEGELPQFDSWPDEQVLVQLGSHQSDRNSR